MESSPGSIETQIDCFLEQFKKSASKVMEDISDNPHAPPGEHAAAYSRSVSSDAEEGILLFSNK